MSHFTSTVPSVLILAFVFLSGCASEGGPGSSVGGDSSPEGEALFAVAGTATPDDVHGVWSSRTLAGEDIEGNLRVRFSPESVEAAARCTLLSTGGTLFAYVRGRARISNSEISVLESKIDTRFLGDLRCSTNIDIATTPVCEGETRSRCFLLEGSRLTIFGATSGQVDELVKISD